MVAPVATPGPRAAGPRSSPTAPTCALDDVDAFADHLVLSERDGRASSSSASDDLDDGDEHVDRDARPRVLGVGRREPRVRHDARCATATRRSSRRCRRSTTTSRRASRDAREAASPCSAATTRPSTTSARLWATARRRHDASRSRSCTGATLALDGTAPAAALRLRLVRDRRSTRRSRRARVSLLDRGFVFAIAHVRGGGELGRRWYEDGKLEHKPQHVHRLHRRAPSTSSREGYTVAGPARGPRRQRRRAAHGRGREPAARPVPRDRRRGAVRRRASPRCSTRRSRSPSPSGRSGATPSTTPTIYDVHEVVLAVRQRRRAGLPGAPRDRRAQRPAGAVLGAGEVGGEAPGDEDRRHGRSCSRRRWAPGHGGPSGRYDAWRDEAFVLAFVLDQLGVE